MKICLKMIINYNYDELPSNFSSDSVNNSFDKIFLERWKYLHDNSNDFRYKLNLNKRKILDDKYGYILQHIPLENLPPRKEFDKNLAPSLLEHYCNINIHQDANEEVHTAIMCDIGARNKDTAFIQCLLAAGMTIAKIELKDLDVVELEEIIQSIRQVVYNYSTSLNFIYPLGVMAALSGPEIITGELEKGAYATIEMVQDQDIKLTNEPSWQNAGTVECLYVNFPGLTLLRRNDVIYIECLGPVRAKLVVQDIGDNSIICHITTGGVIGPKMAVRISQIPYEVEDPRDAESYISLETLSCSTESAAREDSEAAKIDKQIMWALSQDVDAFLLPTTQTTNLIRHIRTLLEPKSRPVLLIASIESLVGLDNIDNILDEADGIYLDRSILSTDLPIEKVFIAQKVLVSKCNKLGKVCICSGVLNEQIAMISIGDLAQLVLDGTDVIALELHYEAPILRSSQPNSAFKVAEQCIEATSVICKQAERIIWARAIYGNIELMKKPHDDPTTSVAVSAVEMALRTKAVVIICLTNSGRSARLIAKARPLCPLIAVTRICHVARQLRFWRGIRTIHYFEEPQPSFQREVSLRVQAALSYCKLRQIVRRGDPYILVTGHRRDAGYTNTVRVMYASLRDEPTEMV